MKQSGREKVSAASEKRSIEQGVNSQPNGETLEEGSSGSEGDSDDEKDGKSEKDLIGKILTAEGL